MERDLVKEQGTVNLACVASLFLLLMIDAEMGLTFSLHFIFSPNYRYRRALTDSLHANQAIKL